MAKVLSMEIGNSITRICEMDYKVKNPKVYKSFCIPTPKGVVEDGFVRENPEFTLSVKRALTENKIKTKAVVFSVASSKIVTREVTIPQQVKTDKIAQYVKANAGDYFPIDLSVYEIAHLVLGVDNSADGQGKYRVMVMAAGRDLISGYIKFANSCGLKMNCIDFAGNSVYQVMAAECGDEATLVVKVEDSSTIASVIVNRTMVLQRTLAYGFERAVNTLMESPEFYESTYSEAFRAMCNKPSIKVTINDRTKVVERDEVMNESELGSEARSKITATFGQIVSNLTRVVELYNSKDRNNPIRQVMIVGLGGEIINLPKLFTNELGIPTQVVKHFSSVSMFQSMDENFVRYVGCMGAAIKPVELFTTDTKERVGFKKTNYVPFTVGLVGICVALNLGMVAAALLPLMSEQDRKTELEAKEKEYATAEPIYHRHLAVAELKNEVITKTNLTLSNNDEIVKFFEELELKMPTDVRLTQFGSSTQAATLGFTVNDYEEGAKILQILRGFSTVRDVSASEFVERTITDERGAEIGVEYNFEAVCTYYPVVVKDLMVIETAESKTE